MPYRDEDFEWDARKARANLRKHGISFRAAQGVFEDPLQMTYVDSRFDYGETREITIGKVEDRLIAVVHTERHGKIRVISARDAEPTEARAYYQVYPEPQ